MSMKALGFALRHPLTNLVVGQCWIDQDGAWWAARYDDDRMLAGPCKTRADALEEVGFGS